MVKAHTEAADNRAYVEFYASSVTKDTKTNALTIVSTGGAMYGKRAK